MKLWSEAATKTFASLTNYVGFTPVNVLMIDCNFWVTPIENQIGKLYKLAVCPWNWLSLTPKEEKQGWIPVSFPSHIILKKNDMTLRAIFFGATRCFVKGIPEKALARKLISIGFRRLCLHAWNNICSFKSKQLSETIALSLSPQIFTCFHADGNLQIKR